MSPVVSLEMHVPRERRQQRLERWVDAYAARLYRVAALSASDEEAGDLTQEVFCVAARKADDFADRSSPYTWLYAILRNLVRDRRRKAARRSAARMELVTQATDPERELSRAQDRRRVSEAVASLSEGQRVVVELFYLGELSVAEVAAELGVPPGTVKSRLYGAREALKRALEGGA